MEQTNEIQIFSNPEFGAVRTTMIEGQPYFIGKDVADILGYSNSRKALADHVDERDKGVTKCDTPGGMQELAVINESGLYSLIFSSKLPTAKNFTHWVTSDVLPSIRRTGTYSISQPQISHEEYELRRKDLDVRGAQILQSLIDKELFPVTPETRTVFAHEIFKLITGHSHLAMLPESKEEWYTATDIGKELGLSANKIGRIAKAHGIKAPEGESNEYGRWIISKSQNSNREVPSFIYNENALEWFRQHCND